MFTKLEVSTELTAKPVEYLVLYDKNWVNFSIERTWTWLANYEKDEYLERKDDQRDDRNAAKSSEMAIESGHLIYP